MIHGQLPGQMIHGQLPGHTCEPNCHERTLTLLGCGHSHQESMVPLHLVTTGINTKLPTCDDK
jgi:hypothetical protein